MRRTGTAARALALVVLATLWGQIAAALEGAYVGVGLAEGMSLRVEPERDGWRAAFVDATGAETVLTGASAGAGMEAENAAMPGGPALVRITPEAVGVAMVILPYDEDGMLRADETVVLAFRRASVAAPARPERYLPPPQGPVSVFDARAFVDSFPFWPPQSAAWGYAAVAPALRTVIRLFPLVQADLLTKLCASPVRGDGLGEALRGQGVTCQDVGAFLRRAQAGPIFDRFKRDVAAERAELMVALACAENLARNDPRCGPSAQTTAQRAISMETVATVLARY